MHLVEVICREVPDVFSEGGKSEMGHNMMGFSESQVSRDHQCQSLTLQGKQTFQNPQILTERPASGFPGGLFTSSVTCSERLERNTGKRQKLQLEGMKLGMKKRSLTVW
ncbi:unnamed protein product [Rangifer tarandus platyrhynchus]|uniref:Uncharacterized protein n=2 Tax=Rangifer tarandus platyrhynchus TaxID=3082113 RepID=A0ABN8ZF09_RANTA|nr:unnamed protein product [Rangifer tarandus platyrhynchus]